MVKKYLFVICMLLYCMTSLAQWCVGATFGATYNKYDRRDYDLLNEHFLNSWGIGGVGVFGQYNLKKWFGIRADLNWTQKNYRVTGYDTDLKIKNAYIQIPVMGAFKCGPFIGGRLSAIGNLGVYGGYWINSKQNGTWRQVMEPYSGSARVDFDKTRDNRLDFGFVGGIGLEYKLWKSMAMQVEVREYWSQCSTVKNYMRHLKDPRYNTTFSLHCAICWIL